MESDPPFESICNKFPVKIVEKNDTRKKSRESLDWELPLIDLSLLYHKDYRSIECKRKIADAAKEWGFFEIINHGIPRDVFLRMQSEQNELFQKPFHQKILCSSRSSYHWGNPTAMSLQEFSWSEAFQLPLSDVPSLSFGGLKEFTGQVSKIGQRIAEILAENLGCSKPTLFAENCTENSSHVRLNRYPPCPNFPEAYGLVPHTDSDFLTVLCQDQIGGLQLLKNGEWFSVNPNQDALIINVGDLFEAWSNGVYKSIKHRVVTNQVAERLSIAYFLCPSQETVIQSYYEPSLYRKFSFDEYKKQIQEDVKSTGTKIGLPRFLK